VTLSGLLRRTRQSPLGFRNSDVHMIEPRSVASGRFDKTINWPTCLVCTSCGTADPPSATTGLTRRESGVMPTIMGVPYDVFLSHNSQDNAVIERLAMKLKETGVSPWLDSWNLTPGGDWQEEIDQALLESRACAVFLGPNGLGDWSREELRLARDRAVRDRSFRLFPVLLPGAPDPIPADALPPFLPLHTWVDLRRGLDERLGLQTLVNAVWGVPMGPPTPEEPQQDVCPYRGLQTFDVGDARYFFGREGDVQRLLERLKETRFLAVLGRSGSGKSSLVRAGVVPSLRDGRLPGSASWPVQILRPGPHPLTALATQLVGRGEPRSMQATVDEIANDPRTLHLATELQMSGELSDRRSLLVVDQFEETFTLCSDEKERMGFIENLTYASSIPDGRVSVIITMRADFYPWCGAYAALSTLMSAWQFLVGPMSTEGLRQAILEPARVTGLRFEEGLADIILDEVEDRPGALPLLEHALLELWERRRGATLTLGGYRESGGVAGAIAKRAEALFDGMTPDEQRVARQAMLRLTQPGEGTEDTRRRAPLSELVTSEASEPDVHRVVAEMVEARLLTTTSDGSGEEWVDVSHEALIRAWPRLRGWLDEDRAGLLVHRRLTDAAHEWQRLQRDDAVLYRGPHLAEASELRSRDDDTLNQLEREFIASSEALDHRERDELEARRERELQDARRIAEARRRSTRLLRLVVVVLTIGVLGSLFAARIAITERNHARQQEAIAIQEQQNNSEQQAFNEAIVLVNKKGFFPSSSVDEYCLSCQLHGISAVSVLSVDGGCTNAFFFVDGQLVGTDFPLYKKCYPSTMAWNRGTISAVSYPVYRPKDPFCCPSGGTQTVRFEWIDGHLERLDPLPKHPLKGERF
jgi:energy-coupling factor transporter ATP-binding protein EcfA2